jgi:hypothetical protein
MLFILVARHLCGKVSIKEKRTYFPQSPPIRIYVILLILNLLILSLVIHM